MMVMVIDHYTKYCILCHFGNFCDDTSCEQVYKYCCPELLLVHLVLVYSTS